MKTDEITCPAGSGFHLPGLGQIDGERPLAQYRHSRVQHGQRKFTMAGNLDRDDHKVDVLVLRELLDRCVSGHPERGAGGGGRCG
nr:hypothetical protein [Micromonospora inaquosa]